MNAAYKLASIFLVVKGVFVIAGCTAEEPMSPREIPVLEEVTELNSGTNLQDPGTYLFVERWTYVSGSADCPDHIFVGFPSYTYHCDGRCDWLYGPGIPNMPINNLTGAVEESPVGWRPIGLAGRGTMFEGAGNGILSELSPINELPYDLSDQEHSIVLHSISSDGSITVQIDEGTYALKPGESWAIEEDEQCIADQLGPEWFMSDSCTIQVTERLTNFGLLQPEQISASNDFDARSR